MPHYEYVGAARSEDEVSCRMVSSTFIPRLEPVLLSKVPLMGMTQRGWLLTPVGIWRGLVQRPLVGSKPRQPPSGRYTSIQAWVEPRPAAEMALSRYPLTKRAGMPRDLAASMDSVARSRQDPVPSRSVVAGLCTPGSSRRR